MFTSSIAGVFTVPPCRRLCRCGGPRLSAKCFSLIDLYFLSTAGAVYSTAVKLHVYLVFVKSIEQELKIQ